MTTLQYVAAWGKDPARRIAVRWRGLTWSEYRKFTLKLEVAKSPMGVYADIYRALVLDGPPVENCPAGIVDFVARKMLETNPFGGEFDDIAFSLQAKRSSQDYIENARALVAAIFRYTFEEIDQWDADTFFDRVAKAEFIAGREINPADPKAKQKKGRQQHPDRLPKKELTGAQKEAFRRRQELGWKG